MSGAWNLLPPPGFQGLRKDLPLTVYERHLPHWRQDGATYFVTFRLGDSLPQAKVLELEMFKAEWERLHAAERGHPTGLDRLPPSSHGREQLAREVMRRVEAWLDQGMGRCVLRACNISEMMVQALHRDDERGYELGCYVVMPNHVYAVVRPLTPNTLPLETILQRWKGGTSKEINRHLRRSGPLWQQETFDRIVRDEEHLWRAVQYIGRNPQYAGLSSAEVVLWIRPSWLQRGWRFE